MTSRQKMNVFEPECLRSIVGITIGYRIKSEIELMRQKSGAKKELICRVGGGVLK